VEVPKVSCGSFKPTWIVVHHAKNGVALMTQQGTHTTCCMVMVNNQTVLAPARVYAATNRTAITLPLQHRLILTQPNAKQALQS
jgi:hypothetical protein